MRDRPSATVLALAVLLILYVGLCPASAKKPSGPIRTGESDDVFNSPSAADFDDEDDLHATPPRAGAASSDDVDDSSLDADEFVGVPPAKPLEHKRPEKASATVISASTSDDESYDILYGRSYVVEFAALGFVVLYLVNYIYGRAVNERIAKAWYAQFKELFGLQFAVLGAYAGDQKGAILKDSQSCFKFYASGRRHCSGMLATLELRKRHDLFSMLLSVLDLSPSRDTLTLEVPMNADEMEPLVFAVVPRKAERKARRTHKDIGDYAGTATSARLSNTFCVLTDNVDLEPVFLDERVCRTLSQNEDLVQAVHFTDQNSGSFPTAKKLLRFTYWLPATAELHRLTKLTEMSMHFIDVVAEVKQSAQALLRAQRKRKEVSDREFKATHEQRQEALQKRKDEMKENLTPEQLRKHEEKLAKAALKRKAPRVKVLR